MIDSKRRFATAAASLTMVLGGFGAAGCGDDDNEGVVEEAGQEVEEAGEDAGAAVDEAGEDIEGEVEGDDSESSGSSGGGY